MLKIDATRFVFWDNYQYVLLNHITNLHYETLYYSNLQTLLKEVAQTRLKSRALQNYLTKTLDALNKKRRATAKDLPPGFHLEPSREHKNLLRIRLDTKGRQNPQTEGADFTADEADDVIFQLWLRHSNPSTLLQLLDNLQTWLPRGQKIKRPVSKSKIKEKTR